MTEHDRWQALQIRRPDEVRTTPGGPVPLGWQAEKRTGHSARLMNTRLPADFPHKVERGDEGDALAVLALGEAMRRDIEAGRGSDVRTAAELGATWRQIADALDTTPAHARGLLRAWATGQHRLYSGDRARGEARPLGLDDERYGAVLALCATGDDGEPPSGMTPEPAIRCLVIRSGGESSPQEPQQ
ncbi:hypothetical protein [Streptomyces sp. NPDC005385]|uniref:hypothetical protein n=1 Tax=Streptomyces sp. NPDC005385 TaxID=3157039 RepID=UPI0033A7C98D